MREVLLYYLIYLAVVSVICMVLYGSDKRRAVRGRRRIRERTLLLTGFLGGAAGALIAMQLFRHKTRHASFWAVNLFSVALHVLIGLWLGGVIG